MSGARLLEVEGLSTVYRTERGTVRAVQDVSFGVDKGEVLGIVGESGCGKTTVAMSLLRLIKPPGKIVAGSVRFESENLFARKRATMREIRGSRIAMVPQAAMHALDPVRTGVHVGGRGDPGPSRRLPAGGERRPPDCWSRSASAPIGAGRTRTSSAAACVSASSSPWPWPTIPRWSSPTSR